jgi:iron complex transport system substrate-binding protein
MSSRKSRRIAAALASALVLAVSGCGSSGSEETSSGATRVFQADNGNVTIPAAPKRIVATGYAVPVLIEADAPLVGISEWTRGLPLMTKEDTATYRKLTKVAGNPADTTNYETIAKVKPDLIIVGVPKPVLGDLDMKRLQSIAPVAVIGPSLPSAWRELSRRQSDAAGRVSTFQQTKDAYEKRAGELKAKYAGVFGGLKFGHVGAYGEGQQGTFQREFAGSWGTNIAGDIGVTYYGQVKKKGGGSKDVSEYPSVEEIPGSLGEADAITYTVNADGSVPDTVKYVLDSQLWKNLPAVKAGKTYALRYTEAATYTSALKTLDAIDQALAPLAKS